MPSIDRVHKLKALQLHGMALSIAELLAEQPRSPVSPELWVDRMIEAEFTERHIRSLRYQLKAAHFPQHRDLTGFQWSAQLRQTAQRTLIVSI